MSELTQMLMVVARGQTDNIGQLMINAANKIDEQQSRIKELERALETSNDYLVRTVKANKNLMMPIGLSVKESI